MKVGEALAWAVFCVAAWLSTASSVTGQELVVAVPAGVACGVAASAGRRAAGTRLTVRWVWLRRAARLPLTVLIGTFWVLAATMRIRPSVGKLAKIKPRTEEQEPAAESHRALGSLAYAAAPTGYVVDADPQSGEMTVHLLADRVPDWARVGLRSADR